MKKKQKLEIAKIISFIGTNFVWVFFLMLILGISMLRQYQLTLLDFIVSFFLVIWTFSAGICLKHKLKLDSPNRVYRSYFLLAITCGWILISLFFWTEISSYLREAFLIVFPMILIILVNNIYYRISFHVSLTTSLLILINHFTNWDLIWSFALVALLGWSRLFLKKHTLLQVVAGFLVPFAVYLILRILGIVGM